MCTNSSSNFRQPNFRPSTKCSLTNFNNLERDDVVILVNWNGEMAENLAEIEALLLQAKGLELELQSFSKNFLVQVSQSQILEDIPQSEGLQGSQNTTELQKELHAQIKLFLNRKEDKIVERVFLKYADDARKLILPTRLHEALGEFGLYLLPEEIKTLLTTMDIDNNGGLDLREFEAALRQPSTPLEQFVKTLPISGMLASCLAVPGAADPLKELCNLDSSRVKTAIEVFSVSLLQVLTNQLDNLKNLLEAKETKAQEDADGSGSKCAVFVMKAGSVKDYHEGFYARIGEYCRMQHSRIFCSP
jgi:Ca2+-binding EF-hand superfamily protein